MLGAGKSASFQVGCSDYSPDSIVWFKNGKRLKNSNSFSITTAALTLADNNDSYYCKIYTCNDTLISNKANLTVLSCPFTSTDAGTLSVNQPLTQKILDTDPKPEFTAVNSLGVGSFIWFDKNGDLIQQDDNTASSTLKPKFRYSDTASNNTYAFSCLFRQSCSFASTESDVYEVTVKRCMHITTQPKDVYYMGQSNLKVDTTIYRDINYYLAPVSNNGEPTNIIHGYFIPGGTASPGGTTTGGSGPDSIIDSDFPIVFTARATGVGPFTYTWVMQPVDSNKYFAIDPTVMATVMYDSVSILRMPFNYGLFGIQFRCVITNGCSQVITKPAMYGSPVYYPYSLNGKPAGITNDYSSNSSSNNDPSAADPIQIGTGMYSYAHADIKLGVAGESMQFGRLYNSAKNLHTGNMGYGWRHSFDFSVYNADSLWYLTYPNGHVLPFIPLNDSARGSIPYFIGNYDKISQNADTGLYPRGFTLTTKSNARYIFDSTGIPRRIENLNGVTAYYNYDSANRLVNISNPGNRMIKFSYDAALPVSHIIAVTAPSGKAFRYSYDGKGNLRSATEPNGDSTLFLYNPSHLMTSIINPLGDTMLANSYDSLDRVIAQKDALNQITTLQFLNQSGGDVLLTYPDGVTNKIYLDTFLRIKKMTDGMNFSRYYKYDIDGNMDSVINQNNRMQTLGLDSLGNVTSLTLPGNRKLMTAFNKFAEPISMTSALSKTSYMNYDKQGNLDSILLADGSHKYYTYFSDGKIKSITDGMGTTTSFIYDSLGDLVEMSAPNGNKFFKHDADGRLIWTKDENGNIASVNYDSNGNVVSMIDALGKQMGFAYDDNNDLVKLTDKKGFSAKIIRDKIGRVIARINPMNDIDSFAYDSRDNLVKRTDPNGHSVSFKYDANNRLISKINAYGASHFEYDSLGNVIKKTDPTGRYISFTYTENNRLASSTDALGNKRTYSYDLDGNIASCTDELGNQTKFTHDALDRLTGITDADSNTSYLSYNANGILKSIIDANSHKQDYLYNVLNELSGYKDAAGNTYSYLYDSVGNLKKIVKPNGTITDNYDALNRLTKATLSSGDTYYFSYDANSNLTSMKNSAGVSSFVYDSLSRLVQFTNPFNKTLKYTYDAASNRTGIIYPGNRKVSYTYDSANKLSTVTDWKGNIFRYYYDAAGRTLKLGYPNGDYCTYVYDAAGRMIGKLNFKKNGDTLSSDIFTLNAAGRRTSDNKFQLSPDVKPISYAYKYRSDDALLTDSVNNYTNDSTGNRTNKKGPSDTLRYNFTADNVVSSITNNHFSLSMQYDPMGNRISQSGKNGKTNYLLNIGSSISTVLEATDSNGNIKADYIYGLGLLEQVDSSGNNLLYHFDAHHNTIAMTDMNDSLHATYNFNTFGMILSRKGTLTQPFTFLGEFGVMQDSFSLYFIRARYYDAIAGRFISKDPLDGNAMNPQTFNKYVYSSNNPVSIFDISGYSGNQDGNAAKGSAASSGGTSVGNYNFNANGTANVNAVNQSNAFADGTGQNSLTVASLTASAGVGPSGVNLTVNGTLISNQTTLAVGGGVTLTNTMVIGSYESSLKTDDGVEEEEGFTYMSDNFGVSGKDGEAGGAIQVGGVSEGGSAKLEDGELKLSLTVELGIGFSLNLGIKTTVILDALDIAGIVQMGNNVKDLGEKAYNTLKSGSIDAYNTLKNGGQQALDAISNAGQKGLDDLSDGLNFISGGAIKL